MLICFEESPFLNQWKFLELGFCLIICFTFCALEERKYLALCDWLKLLDFSMQSFHKNKTSNTLFATLIKILTESELLVQKKNKIYFTPLLFFFSLIFIYFF